MGNDSENLGKSEELPVGWLEGIRRIYKPLRWLLVGFLLLLIAVPLLQQCVLGILQGKSCKWQPTWSFFTANYLWIVPLLLMLVVLLITSWRAKLHYEARQRQQERLQQARQRFDLRKPANELRPDDLNFHIVESGKPDPKETLAQSQRPFHEGAYISRKAIPYHLRGEQDPQPQYTEDKLVRLLQDGKGFILQGPPTDGKSRSLYEVITKMNDYEVVSPKANEVPSDEDIEVLLKGRKIVLLLDDLTNYVGAELDLHEFGKRLSRDQVSWVVACSCRDGPQLESVRKAETRELKIFYEDIPLKLKLLELSAEEKRRLALNIGKEWEPEESEYYPTPGSITMEEYKRYMRERFERDLSDLQQDTLRALKLLTWAGILPITHRRVKALLEDERLFDWRDHDINLRRECLDKLSEYAFIGRPPAPEVVKPEYAYLADDVVPYIEGKRPEQDFDTLMRVLEDLEDSEGLFYLGNTYLLTLGDVEKALEAYDAALQVSPDDADTLNNKGAALNSLGRYEEALEAFDAALQISPDNATALGNKGYTYRLLERYKEAIEALDAALHISPEDADFLYNKGNALGNLGRYEEALEAYDAALEIRPDFAEALSRRSAALVILERYEEAKEAFEAVLEIRPDDADALYGKGTALYILGRHEEALEAFEAALQVSPEDADALSYKGDTYRLLERYEEALADLNRAIEFNPDNALALANRGNTYREMGRYEEALADFNQAIELDPHSALAFASRGETFRLMRHYGEALADLDRTIELDPEDDWSLRNRGETYLLTGRYEEALAELDKAIGLNAEDDWHHYDRALAYLVLGQRDDAAIDLRTAIQLALQRYASAEGRQDWRNTFDLAIYHLAAEETEKAKSLYQDALSSGASPYRIHEAIGDLDDFLTVFPSHTQAKAMRDLLQRSLANTRDPD